MPTYADLPNDLIRRIDRLPEDLRLTIEALIEDANGKLPDTPEGIAAFVAGVLAAIEHLELLGKGGN